MLAHVKGSLFFSQCDTSGWQKSTTSAARNSLLPTFTAAHAGLLHGLAKG